MSFQYFVYLRWYSPFFYKYYLLNQRWHLLHMSARVQDMVPGGDLGQAEEVLIHCLFILRENRNIFKANLNKVLLEKHFSWNLRRPVKKGRKKGKGETEKKKKSQLQLLQRCINMNAHDALWGQKPQLNISGGWWRAGFPASPRQHSQLSLPFLPTATHPLWRWP